MSNGIHDTEETPLIYDTHTINIPESQEIVTCDNLDDFDLKNWYRFHNLTNKTLDKIMDLCIKANKMMWNFNISNIEGSFSSINEFNWKQAVDKQKKIIIILILSNNSSLKLYDNEITELTKNNLVLFPSYLMFKCKNVAIFYANGNTFS